MGVACDQTGWAIFINTNFLFWINLFEFTDVDNAVDNVRKNLVDVVKANWCLWPGVQLINIGIVPIKFRVLFVNFFAIFWTTYLSWRNNREANKISAEMID